MSRRSVVGFVEFEQRAYRSAVEREGHARARSRAGDLYLTIHSLRKWALLALQGNPTVSLLLYLPDEALVIRTKSNGSSSSLRRHSRRVKQAGDSSDILKRSGNRSSTGEANGT